MSMAWDPQKRKFVEGTPARQKTGGSPVWNPVTRHFETASGETWGSQQYEARRKPSGGGYGGTPFSHFRTEQQRPSGTTTTTTSTRTKPDIPLPTFNIPERDEEREKELREKYMYLRPYRRGLERALLSIGREENPAIRKYRTGEALSAFSETVGGEVKRATKEGVSTYGRERADAIMALSMSFQAAMQDYLAQYGQKQVSTMQYQYGDINGGGKEEWAYGPFGPSHKVIR